MISSALKIAFYTIVFLLLSPVMAAYASGEEGGNAQSPVQVVVQIVVTAVVIKVLSRFDLP